jgi:hypothetical protein
VSNETLSLQLNPNGRAGWSRRQQNHFLNSSTFVFFVNNMPSVYPTDWLKIMKKEKNHLMNSKTSIKSFWAIFHNKTF